MRSWLYVLVLAAFLPGSVSAQTKYANVAAELNAAALKPGAQGVIALVFDVKPGFHAQSHTPRDPNLIACSAALEANPAIEALEPVYPPGKDEVYPDLGAVSVYTGKTVIYVPFTMKPDAPSGAVTINGSIRYQACNDKMCFAPQKGTFAVEMKVDPAAEAASPKNAELFAGFDPKVFATAKSVVPSAVVPSTGPASVSQADAVSFRPEETKWSTGFAFTMAILAGLLFNIMPCVLPVLPLKAVGFYEVSQHRRGRSLLLGVVFSIGMISVFALLGILVLGLQWLSWGELFSKPWFVWPLSIFLILMAAGLFGAFNVTLPTGVYSFTPRHDTLGGNFFWGALTAIMATPCTAPLLPGLLIWAAAQPAAVGVASMVLVGVGMSLPYLILSAMPEVARKFPRSGPWPELFKQMMGFAMLAVAVFFIAGRLIHGSSFWWAVVLVLAMACVFLVARTVQLSKNATPLAVSSVIAVLTLGLSIGWAAKLNGLFSHQSTVAGFVPFTDQAFADARASGKPVLIKFTANWCLSCQYIEGTVFQDANVWAAISGHHVVALKADLTEDHAPGHDLLLKLNPGGGIPLTAIYAPGAKEPIQLSSVYSSRTLLQALDKMEPNSVALAKP